MSEMMFSLICIYSSSIWAFRVYGKRRNKVQDVGEKGGRMKVKLYFSNRIMYLLIYWSIPY